MITEKKESLVFYGSFKNAIDELDTAEEKVSAYNAIIEYGLTGESEEILKDIKGAPKAIFLMAMPQIEANWRRYENGKKGGRPSKENQDKTKDKPNVNDNENINVNNNDKDNVNINNNDNDNDLTNLLNKHQYNIDDINKCFEAIYSLYPYTTNKEVCFQRYCELLIQKEYLGNKYRCTPAEIEVNLQEYLKINTRNIYYLEEILDTLLIEFMLEKGENN